jgi:hypothetical protein
LETCDVSSTYLTNYKAAESRIYGQTIESCIFISEPVVGAYAPNQSDSCVRAPIPTLKSYALFVWLISHQLTVPFSQNKSATSNQPVVLFFHNKPAPAISHQSNEQRHSLAYPPPELRGAAAS